MLPKGVSDAESEDSYETCDSAGQDDGDDSAVTNNEELFIPIKIRRLEMPTAPFIDELKVVQKLKCSNNRFLFLSPEYNVRPNRNSSVLNENERVISKYVSGSTVNELKSSLNDRSVTITKEKPLVTISTWAESRQLKRSREDTDALQQQTSEHNYAVLPVGLKTKSSRDSPKPANPLGKTQPAESVLHILTCLPFLKNPSFKIEPAQQGMITTRYGVHA